MRDEESTAATPEQMTFAEDVQPTPEQPEPTPEELQAAELSRAAREAVRHPADPRIDRQLARMGLADDDAAAPGDGGRVAARVVRAEDVERLEAALAEAQAASADAQARLARADRRLQLLTWAVTLEGIAVAILAVLLLLT
jgi:hypothetical protein